MDLRSHFRNQSNSASLRRLARPQLKPATRDGAGVTLSGNPIRGATVSNEALGTGDGVFLASDSGVSQQERRRIRRSSSEAHRLSELFNIKVFCKKIDGSTTRYYVGGDQTAREIFSVNTLSEFVLFDRGEATGPEKADWLLAIGTRVVGTADANGNSDIRLRVIYGDGQASWENTSKRNAFLQYRGGGYWSSGIIEYTSGYTLPTTYSSQTTGSFGSRQVGLWQGAISSGFGYEIGWAIPRPYLQSGGTGQVFTSTTQGAQIILTAPNNTIATLFPIAPSGNYFGEIRNEAQWVVVPGPVMDISGVGGDPCVGDGPSTTVHYGDSTRSYSETESKNTQFSIFSMDLFTGVSRLEVGASTTTYLENRYSSSTSLGPESFTMAAVCDLTLNKYRLSWSGPGEPRESPEASQSGNLLNEYNKEIDTFLSPTETFHFQDLTRRYTPNVYFDEPLETIVYKYANAYRYWPGAQFMYFSNTTGAGKYYLNLGSSLIAMPPVIPFFEAFSSLITTDDGPIAYRAEEPADTLAESDAKLKINNWKLVNGFWVEGAEIPGAAKKIGIPGVTVESAWYWPNT